MTFTMTFNGIELPILVSDVGGRGPLSQETVRTAIPGKSGSIYQNRRFPERSLPITFSMKSTSLEQLRVDVDDLNNILNVDSPAPIVFSDEQDKTYYGILDGTPDWEEIINIGKGTLHFICPDPFKYGPEQSTTSLTLNNNGMVDTEPTIQADLTSAASSFKVTNQKGKYLNIIYNFAAGDQLILDFAKRKITINGIIHMTALDWANSEWFALYPGENVLTVEPDGVANVQIKYTERWL